MELYFLQREQVIAHVGERVIAERIGKTNELALIRALTHCTMVSARVLIVLSPA
jgi:hypothetical protein